MEFKTQAHPWTFYGKQIHAERLNEEFWVQRAHHNSIKEGDCNTSYFHAQVKKRQKKNTIQELRDENGEVQSGQNTVQQGIIKYFYDMFKSTELPMHEMQFPTLSGRVSVEDRLSLTTWHQLKLPTYTTSVLSFFKSIGTSWEGMRAILYWEY